jgi:hypothetical protein
MYTTLQKIQTNKNKKKSEYYESIILKKGEKEK